MNIVKVYDINGKHGDSFRKLQKKAAINLYHGGRFANGRVFPLFGDMVRLLNKRQFFIRRQFKDTRAALGNVGLFSTSGIGASIRSMFK